MRGQAQETVETERADVADERALHDAAQRAAERWGDQDLAAYASDRVRRLAAGSTTDWGLSGGTSNPRRPPISLAGGIPDAATQPKEALLEAMRRALATPDDAPLVYGGGRGYEPLREQIATAFARDQQPAPSADAFVLTNGAAGAIDLVCAALIDPGDVVLSEVPTFTGSLRTFTGHQAEVVGIHMDEDGIRLDHLEAAITRLRADGRRPKLLYTIPTFQNPTGLDMSLERRVALVDLAAEHGILILEDAAYAELFFGPARRPSLSAIAGGQGVITAGTFSKTIATGLRVGWVQAPLDLIPALLATRFEMGNSPLLHRMLSEYMAGGGFDDHVETMRALYRRKVEALAGALGDLGGAHVGFATPAGGFFLWLRLLGDLRARDVQAAAMEEGVIFPVGEAFYPGRDPGPDGEHIRLAYSWTAEADLVEAARRLAWALERTASGTPPGP
jgi:2-aminoadipate transaminase